MADRTEPQPASPMRALPPALLERVRRRNTNRPGIKQKKRHLVQRAIAVGIVALLALVLYVAVAPRPVPVEAALVRRGPMQVAVDEDGFTRVRDRYVVSAPLAGRLLRPELHVGDRVEEGSVLARIVPPAPPLLDVRTRSEAQARVSAAEAAVRQAKASVQQAEAERELAVRNAARVRSLRQQEVATLEQLERAEFAAQGRQAALASAQFASRVAEHELSSARAALARFTSGAPAGEAFVLTSPVAGQVLRVPQESEALVQAGAPLLEVGDAHDLEIVVDVLTEHAVRIQPGAPVRIDHWGGSVPLEGRVRLVEPSAYTKTSALGVDEQRVNVIVDLTSPQDDWRSLGDRFRVDTHILEWQAADVLQARTAAIFRQGEGWAAYVVEGNRARLRSVRIGQRNDTDAEVLSGLQPGERVILYPSDQVHDGVRVTIR